MGSGALTGLLLETGTCHETLAAADRAGSASGGPALAQDRVSYIDRTLKPPKNEVDLDGVIEDEGPLGLRIKAKGGVKLIAPGDITQITYKVQDLSPADFRKPFVAERQASRRPRATRNGPTAWRRRWKSSGNWKRRCGVTWRPSAT